MPTKIEWATESWNPVTGCTPVSEGCVHCYARRMAQRLAGRFGYPAEYPFAVTAHPERLEEPLQWKKPRRVFVCSMGDLFHRLVSDSYIWQVFNVMRKAQQHTFLVLTKRPQRMLEWFNFIKNTVEIGEMPWPLPNVWLGVTAENQKRADERIPILLQTPAAVRFASVEPMLGPVDLTKLPLGPNGYGLDFELDALTGWAHGYNENTRNHRVSRNDQFGRLDWVICGGETGPSARPMHPNWVRGLRDQCQVAGVPFFFKHHGEWRECEPPDQWDSANHKTIQAHGTHFVRLDKKAAGRLLDGEQWNEMPPLQPAHRVEADYGCGKSRIPDQCKKLQAGDPHGS